MEYEPHKYNRHSIRLKGYDYSQSGLYFVTICCHNRECLFGEIVDGKMILNQYGKIASNEWIKTPQIRQNIALHEFVIMPNHVHFIIEIIRKGGLNPPCNSPDNTTNNNMGECNSPLQCNNDSRKGGLNPPCNPPCNSTIHGTSQTIGAIVRGYKSAVTRQLNAVNIGCRVWQRNYYEHIIRNEESYLKISEYVTNNPANWHIDSLK